MSQIEPEQVPNDTAPLSAAQAGLLAQYTALLAAWNEKVNLVSRRLSAEGIKQHVRHCLALTRRRLPNDAHVVDWGTGGGLPAIPLAIACPSIRVTAIDARGKKVNAVNDMVSKLGLTNIRAIHTRAEEWDGNADLSVSRATAPLVTLWSWHRRIAKPRRKTGDDPTRERPEAQSRREWASELLALKGGDLTDEITSLQRKYPATSVEIIPLTQHQQASDAKYIISVTHDP